MTSDKGGSHATPADHGEFMVCTKNWTNETLTRSSSGLVDSALDLMHRLRVDFDLIEEYECLGIFFVRSKKQQAIEAFENHPGCLAIAQYPEPISVHASTMRALECVHNQTCYQVYESRVAMFERGLRFPNSRYEGGIFPAGEYPISRTARRSVQPSHAIASLAAWLPVINLSFGPKTPCEASPVNLALARLSETHLITVAAGNSGPAATEANINTYAPNFHQQSGIVCVGATNADGTDLASYSSTGVEHAPHRRPCVVASGERAGDGLAFGTSFAAPRVATLACLICDAVMQVHRIANSVNNPESQFGIPLVGWAVIDEANGEALTYSRKPLNAMPFVGPRDAELNEAFIKLKGKGISPWFSVHALPVRTILLRSARSLPGRKQHEVGNGFVSRDGVITFLAKLQLGDLLDLFCENVPTDRLPTEIRNIQVFDRDDLEELFRVASDARPIWTYDTSVSRLFVNSPGGQRALDYPVDSHALQVTLSGQHGHT